MIPEFERLVRKRPDDICFTFVEKDGSRIDRCYDRLRLEAAALAIILQKRGIGRDSLVSVDMDNCPAFIVCALAAAYGGFALVALNHRLTEDEKASRLADLGMSQNTHIAAHLDEQRVDSILGGISFPDWGGSMRDGLFGKRAKADSASMGRARAECPSQAEIIHFAERGAAFFNLDARALVLFTSGTSGRPKAASLSWGNLCGAAQASNTLLNATGQGLWQAALPLFHIGGFEIFVRSILNASPFILYRRFDPARILTDADECGATHLSVVDKMLQDLLAADRGDILKRYTCVLLGGAAANPFTLADAVARGLHVFSSYGMTETSSQIAASSVTQGHDGRLALLPGYEVEVISPDELGFGQLAVKGPGVFSGYLNASAAFTADGFFLTGDTASIDRGMVKIRERTADMFVSGGENIYPAEIQDKLLRVPGVRDAYVFGVSDEVWGRRPAAFVERDASAASTAGSPQSFSGKIAKSLEQRLSKLYLPRFIGVLDSFPRIGIGKIDREGLQQIYDERIEVHEVRVYHIEQKLLTPIVTAKTTLRTRESAIIEVVDGQGRTGIGECVAFPTDWYLPETLGEDIRILEDHLIPLVLGQVYLHPREVSACFDECREAEGFPLAKGALEPALWDLYGKIVQEPLWRLIKEEAVDGFEGGLATAGSEDKWVSGADGLLSDYAVAVPAGMVIGIMTVKKTLEAVQQAVDSGYTRVKLKVKPGDDLARVRAVRKAFPDLTIMLDANQSYTERDREVFSALDALNIRCIEEPLDPRKPSRIGPDDIFARLARLQKETTTPLCLDESIISAEDLGRALEYPELRCYALKIAKWGGIGPALGFYQQACSRGIDLWMGGMYETGVSKSLHAAFEALSGITIPGDLGSTAHYFTTDVCSPAFEPQSGMVVLNQPGYETGLGHTLDYETLSKVLISEEVFYRQG